MMGRARQCGAPGTDRRLPSEPTKTPMLILAALAMLAIGWVEIRTPVELSFSIFYFIPVVVATWFGGYRWGVFLSLCTAAQYLLANYLAAPVYDRIPLRLWTATNELAGHLFMVYVVERLRRSMAAEREKQQLLQEALLEVQSLESLLPVCAWCKKVRDDQGYWSQLEAFIAAKTRTRFSHGICPDCSEKVRQENPDLFAAVPSAPANPRPGATNV